MNGRRNISSFFANTGRDAHLASDSPAESDMPMNLPPLRTLFFEDLSIGMTERLEKTVASSDVVGFAQLTGDRNPIHLSEHFAAKTSFRTRIAHGLYTASLISAVLGTRLPGPGAVYISQTLNFRAPVKIGDTVFVTVTVAELMPEKSRARLSCLCEVDVQGVQAHRGYQGAATLLKAVAVPPHSKEVSGRIEPFLAREMR